MRNLALSAQGKICLMVARLNWAGAALRAVTIDHG
jgi:hypothetical protein